MSSLLAQGSAKSTFLLVFRISKQLLLWNLEPCLFRKSLGVEDQVWEAVLSSSSYGHLL